MSRRDVFARDERSYQVHVDTRTSLAKEILKFARSGTQYRLLITDIDIMTGC